MVQNLKLTTAFSGCIVESDLFKCVVNSESVNATTGEIITGNVQVQKKTKTEGGEDTTIYAGNYNISLDGGNSAGAAKGMTLSEIEAAAVAAIAEVKAEILK